jgi:hypothetical protein
MPRSVPPKTQANTTQPIVSGFINPVLSEILFVRASSVSEGRGSLAYASGSDGF